MRSRNISTRGRYIGPAEAVWNLMEFPAHEEFPVQELTVPLLDQQLVYFKPNMTEQQIQANMDRSHWTLTAFFDYNAQYTDDRHLLYPGAKGSGSQHSSRSKNPNTAAGTTTSSSVGSHGSTQ